MYNRIHEQKNHRYGHDDDLLKRGVFVFGAPQERGFLVV